MLFSKVICKLLYFSLHTFPWYYVTHLDFFVSLYIPSCCIITVVDSPSWLYYSLKQQFDKIFHLTILFSYLLFWLAALSW